MQETSGNGLWCVSVFHKLDTDLGHVVAELVCNLQFLMVCIDDLSCDDLGPSL